MILENRKNLHVTGVKDVAEFNDEKVVLNTELGELTIDGERLNISQFAQETGELMLEGKIDTLIYNENQKNEGGFFSRIFK